METGGGSTTAPPNTTHKLDEAPGGVGALVFGILGFVVLPIIGSIVALVLGYRARKRSQQEPDRYRDSLARSGRILGWVGIAVFGALIVHSLALQLYWSATFNVPSCADLERDENIELLLCDDGETRIDRRDQIPPPSTPRAEPGG